MAVGSHYTSADGTLVKYDKVPITSPAYTPSDKQRVKLFESLLESEGCKSAITTKMVALERFETILDIYDHDTPNDSNPAPISTHNEYSQTAMESIAVRQIKSLLKNKVPQKTNMSITELLDLPCEAYRIIVSLCEKMEKSSMQEKNRVGTEIENLHNEMQQ